MISTNESQHSQEPQIKDVYDILPGQDRKTMPPEEFQAALEFFSMLAQARDVQRKKEKAGRPSGTLEP